MDPSTSVLLEFRYRLHERLAVGGMGEVYRATDERLGREVAVKILSRPLASSPDFVERFRREALTAAGLVHPNIAQVFDYGLDGDDHFIVMEYVPGLDLARVLRDHGRLRADVATDVMAQVCAALGAAHRSNVVHRDVKAGNVMIPPGFGPDSPDSVKVTDFGIARALGQSSLTDTGTVMGTAGYLPPELARGEGATPASDVYSAGILLYQVLTGSMPFTGETPVAIMLRHLDEPVPAPSTTVPGIPLGLDLVVARATAKNPRDRYPDGEAMSAALRRLSGHQVPAAPADPEPTQAWSTTPDPVRTTVLPPQDEAPYRPGSSRAGAYAAAPSVAAPAAPYAPSRNGSGHPYADPAAYEQEPYRPASVTGAPPASRATLREAPPKRRSSGVGVIIGLLAVAVIALGITIGALLNRKDPTPPPAAVGSEQIQPSDETPQETPSDEPTPTTEAPPREAGVVPADVVGLDREAGIEAVRAAKFRYQWVVVASDAPKDEVIGTIPAGGVSQPEGQTVVLVVSRGASAAGSSWTVPEDAIGAKTKDLVKQAEDAKVRVTTLSVASDGPKGRVQGTFPGPGEAVPGGDVVIVSPSGDKD